MARPLHGASGGTAAEEIMSGADPAGGKSGANPDALLSRELGVRQFSANIFNYTVGSGIFSLLRAGEVLGVIPRVIGAPGYTGRFTRTDPNVNVTRATSALTSQFQSLGASASPRIPWCCEIGRAHV